jgi:hypothetical protein
MRLREEHLRLDGFLIPLVVRAVHSDVPGKVPMLVQLDILGGC